MLFRMNRFRRPFPSLLALAALVVGSAQSVAQDADPPFNVDELNQRIRQGELRVAYATLSRGINARPTDLVARSARAQLAREMGWHAAAERDLSILLEVQPTKLERLDHRGSERFFLGRFNEAMADFDEFLRAQPEEGPGHWRRGIVCLYAGQHEEGRKQFEAYQRVDGNDVENAVWWYLCAVKGMGREQAAAAMPKIGHDRRVPLMVIDRLFRGQATPADVLTAIDEGQPETAEKRNRNFYGHLYLGLWFDSNGDLAEARKHLRQAAIRDYLPGYMGDVARVHLRWVDQRLAAGEGKKPGAETARKAEPKKEKYASDMEKFAKADVDQPGAADEIVFVGSSTIRLWKLEKHFPGRKVINRGFGGSTAADAVRHADRLLARPGPAVMVYYEGDNDLGSGRTPIEVANDVSAFLAKTAARWPRTRVIVLGVKPSILRWHLFDEQRRTNELLASVAAKVGNARFVDLGLTQLDPAGRPIPDDYQDDGLHLSEAGYEKWSKALAAILVSK
jgi:lipoprotein NlpI